ncbi:hypothetical protein BH09VER1_BH09VER1_16320 [soil metagenome]
MKWKVEVIYCGLTPDFVRRYPGQMENDGPHQINLATNPNCGKIFLP